jgi:antimicrobial peptide system SdpB family protein
MSATLNSSERFPRFLERVAVPRFVTGASAFRIVSGWASLYLLMMCWPYRHFLFGPDSVYPREYAAEAPWLVSLFSLPTSAAAFEALYLVTCAVAIAWTTGLATRWLTPVHAILMTSLLNRNPSLPDGGDNVFRIVIWFACFAILDGTRKADERKLREPSPAGLLHNAAVLAMAIQLSIVYMSAGLAKVMGPSWRDGTAIYYALSAREYYMPGLSDLVRHNSFLVLLGTYGTVVFQVLFPALIVANRWTRRCAVACGLLFHLGIATSMNLITFAAYMLAVDLLLLTDGEYAWLRRIGIQWTAWVRRAVSSTVGLVTGRKQNAILNQSGGGSGNTTGETP